MLPVQDSTLDTSILWPATCPSITKSRTTDLGTSASCSSRSPRPKSAADPFSPVRKRTRSPPRTASTARVPSCTTPQRTTRQATRPCPRRRRLRAHLARCRARSRRSLTPALSVTTCSTSSIRRGARVGSTSFTNVRFFPSSSSQELNFGAVQNINKKLRDEKEHLLSLQRKRRNDFDQLNVGGRRRGESASSRASSNRSRSCANCARTDSPECVLPLLLHASNAD